MIARMLSTNCRNNLGVREEYDPPVTSYTILAKPFNFEPGAPETSYAITFNGGETIPPVTYRAIYPSLLDLLVPNVHASLPGGSGYIFPINVTLTADFDESEPVALYYTLDGSYPTSGSSPYTGEIAISSQTKLRFVGIDSAGNIGVDVLEDYKV